MAISEKAKQARREYFKKYREKNRDRILARQREHYQNNKEKYQEYQQSYWERKVQESENK